jgi:hypothetical protein
VPGSRRPAIVASEPRDGQLAERAKQTVFNGVTKLPRDVGVAAVNRRSGLREVCDEEFGVRALMLEQPLRDPVEAGAQGRGIDRLALRKLGYPAVKEHRISTVRITRSTLETGPDGTPYRRAGAVLSARPVKCDSDHAEDPTLLRA